MMQQVFLISSSFCLLPALPAFLRFSFIFQSWTGAASPPRQNAMCLSDLEGRQLKGKVRIHPSLYLQAGDDLLTKQASW